MPSEQAKKDAKLNMPHREVDLKHAKVMLDLQVLSMVAPKSREMAVLSQLALVAPADVIYSC